MIITPKTIRKMIIGSSRCLITILSLYETKILLIENSQADIANVE